jgi:hypothetical protein
MKWTTKARIMKACSALPKSEEVYKFIQKNFGRLDGNPWSRLTPQKELGEWILSQGREIEGKTIFEVGTGHIPVVPIGFFLMGAGDVITVDLNRRIDLQLFSEALQWISDRRQQVIDLYADVVDRGVLANRIDTIEKYINNPLQFMSAANIRYIAPGDASNTGLSSESIDYHISNTVLEHIDGENILKIMSEAERLMKSDGLAIHFIDLSDHFQHQDSQINKINFLKYTEKEWLRIAGNNFAYCNRLRSSVYLELFDRFKILKIAKEVDRESLSQLTSGEFIVDPEFAEMDREDLACTALSICLAKSRN